MARVYIPAQWRDLSVGVAELQVPGDSLAEVVAALDERFPGIAARLVEDGQIAAGMAVSIDGAVTARGLLTPVAGESEVHFLPAIGGG